MFNRVEIGEIIFQSRQDNVYSPWELFLQTGNGKQLEEKIRELSPNGPWCTGAYLITSKKGFDKLGGICSILEDFYYAECDFNGRKYNWSFMADMLLHHRGEIRLKDLWLWLQKVPFFGTFHSHEMVQDLRYTALLDQAPDINSWTNPGPGAKRGLNRLHGRDKNAPLKREQAIQEMIYLLNMSGPDYWPNNQQYPILELHQIEFQLCEYDKYLRVLYGEGTPRSIYR